MNTIKNLHPTNKKWWHDKVAYQIYPKSFLDTNGDGIGDLRGIISKLDYLKELGVDIIWLSPIYKSPFVDQGYDISDYYAIAEEFGTMEEFDELLAESKKRGISIIMDLVINHCSDKHEWFKKALADPDGEYADYFFFREGKNGNPPSNYRSYFGGSCWEPVPNSNKYYLHMFAKEQPDLNWENPALLQKLYDMINWWLEKGLGGFRIDAIINIKKKLPFSDYPADRADGLCSVERMLEEAEGIGEFLGEMAEKCFHPYDAFTVGEVFNEKEDEIKDFIGENGYFSSMFDFEETCYGKSANGWYASKPYLSPEEYKKCIFHTQKKIGDTGMISNIIENHDEPRGVCHYISPEDRCPDSKKLLAGIYFLLKGIPFIYQGQEIGMENMEFTSMDQIDDISTIDEYQVALRAGCSEKEALDAASAFSRDNARTPVQWSAEKNAGFTTADKPWFYINDNYKEINVEAAEKDENSILNYYRKLLKLRKENPIIIYGDFKMYNKLSRKLFVYERSYEGQRMLVINSFSEKPVKFKAPADFDITKSELLISNYDCKDKSNAFTLRPYESRAYLIK